MPDGWLIDKWFTVCAERHSSSTLHNGERVQLHIRGNTIHGVRSAFFRADDGRVELLFEHEVQPATEEP